MSPIFINPEDVKQLGKVALFRKVGQDSFVINSVSIITPNLLVKKNVTYDLLDLLDDGKIYITKFKFINAVLRNSYFFIIGIDTLTGVVMHRHHILDNGEAVCNWLLVDSDSLFPDESDNSNIDYCNGK